MRCSKLCIGLLVVGIGGAAVFASMGNAKAASLLTFLPFLACPLMCVMSMMFGRSCHDEHQRVTRGRKTPRHPPSNHVED